MNIDHILRTLNREQVQYLLIGGMNFSLRHAPYTTFDIDLWIENTAENRARCERALAALDAEWGATDATWQPVAKMQPDWLTTQALFCLHSPHGSIDVFLSVKGLEDWQVSRQSAVREQTGAATEYWGLSDGDMLKRQLALESFEQKRDRIATLQRKLGISP